MSIIMRSIIVLFSFIGFANILYAQDCYATFFDQGIEAYDALDFEKAIRQFNAAKICDDKPDNNEVDEWIVKTQTGYIDAIRAARDEALKLKTEAVALRSFVKGQEREFKSFYKEAIDEYTTAVRMIPTDTLFREQRAQLAMSLEVKEYKMAKDDLIFLIENGNPDKLSGYEDNLAYVLEQMDDFNGALVAQREAERTAPAEQKDLYSSKIAILEDKKIKRNSGVIPNSGIIKSRKAKNSILKPKIQKGTPSCDLLIKFKIAGKTLTPNRKGQIRLDQLAVGTYQYEILGKVKCSNKPSWPAIGKGTISIRANSEYYLYWELTKYRKCEMTVKSF